MIIKAAHKTDVNEQISSLLEEIAVGGWTIVLYNDEVNTFDWVIKTLVEVCGHEQEQAEQCAMIIHSKGKYGVKNGSYDLLKPMCDAITDRGIGATVEELAS